MQQTELQDTERNTRRPFGLILLIIATFAQIAFGNIPPEAGFGRSMRLFAIFMGITAALFVISILVAPLLVWLGR